MNVLLFPVIFMVMFMTVTAAAADDSVSMDPCAPIVRKESAPGDSRKSSLWFAGGHLESGLFANSYGRKNAYENGFPDPDGGNTELLQNVRQSDFQLNQLYLNVGKKLGSHRRFDVGGRIDFMFGTDAVFLQSEGLESDADRGTWVNGDYYTALPQMYLEAGTRDFSVKMGKFLSTMSSESILSPDRFFYSFSDSREVLPETFTGVLGTWNVNSRLSVFGGWVNGENRRFHPENENAFLGDISYQWNKRIKFAYSALARLDTKTRTRDDRFSFVQSFIIGYKHKRTDYAFEWVLRDQKTGSGGRLEYGINQELIYKLTPEWSLGARFGWMHRFTKSGMEYDRYNLSFGTNWKPNTWLIVRPEIRYDISDGTLPFNKPRDGSPGGRKDQFSGGVSVTIKF